MEKEILDEIIKGFEATQKMYESLDKRVKAMEEQISLLFKISKNNDKQFENLHMILTIQQEEINHLCKQLKLYSQTEDDVQT